MDSYLIEVMARQSIMRTSTGLCGRTQAMSGSDSGRELEVIHLRSGWPKRDPTLALTFRSRPRLRRRSQGDSRACVRV